MIERADRFAYVLCRTSNPGAGELQDLEVAAARWAPEGAALPARRPPCRDLGPGGTVGLVVGATAPRELEAIRRSRRPAFLVPGIGAQGGEVDAVLAAGRRRRVRRATGPGRGLLVNVSRGIAAAATDDAWPGRSADLGERLAEAAREWAAGSLCYPSGAEEAPRNRPIGRSSHGTLPQEHRRSCRLRTPELIIVLMIALVIFGPGKLPEIGHALGKSIREFRKASSDVQDDEDRRRHVAAAADRSGGGSRAGRCRRPRSAPALSRAPRSRAGRRLPSRPRQPSPSRASRPAAATSPTRRRSPARQLVSR